MRVTVDIADEMAGDLARITGEANISFAVCNVVTGFIKREKAKEFGRLLREGAFDFPMTNDELENIGN